MPATRVFISYSCAREGEPDFDPVARDFVLEVHDTLLDRGYEPWLDRRRLAGGDWWDPEIRSALGIAHAGVLLLTEHSVSRPWVLQEATIMANRARNPRDEFRLLPVSLGVGRDQLEEEKFDPLVLEGLQRVDPPTAANIVAALEDRIQPGRPPLTSLDRAISDLADHLGLVAVDRLEDVADRLGVPPQERWDLDGRERLAAAIARFLLTTGLGNYADIYELLNDIGTRGRADASRILEIVAPCWIPLQSGENLAAVVAGLGELILVSSKPAFASEMYVRRAYPDHGRVVVAVPGGDFGGTSAGETATRLVEMIRRELASHFNLSDASAESVRQELQYQTYPVFLQLPPPVPDRGVLEALREELPGARFVIHHGFDVPDNPESFDPVVVLAPIANAQDELAAYVAHERAVRFVRS